MKGEKESAEEDMNAEEPEKALTEEEYKRRRPHSSFKELLALEKLVPDASRREQLAAAVTKPLGIKQLLMVLEMARDASGDVDVNDFAACLAQFIDD